ncbi:MAG: adenylate/guanylate cyclase domain-containing protein [Reyranellaceae bacterium]
MSEQRRLAAILVADVVGYSRLVGQDEAGTLARLSVLRREVIEPTIARHAGRLFKAVGDGFLVEFASAVQAVSCAKAIQEANAGGGLPLRIGIHVGDVVVQGDDLMGDGVNIAARIEGIADPGSIAISRAVHEQVRDKLDVSFVDKGEVALKNLARPLQVFALSGTVPPSAVEAAPVLALPDKPSIAVLPFQNMSGDPEQEFFGDGIAEDIITALSRLRDFFVIARNSSFTYKGMSPDIRQVGRDLGVRYVLEGSVRKAGSRLRITAQLIEAATGNHLWAERYDRAAIDIFDVQDEITESVVASLEPQLLLAEGTRSKRRTATDLDSWSLVARAFSHKVLFSDMEARRALVLLERAVEIDPGYARALAELAQVRALIAYNYRTAERAPAMALALETARKAVSLDPDDPGAHFALGIASILSRHLDEAIVSLSRAVELNPNHAFALARLGSALAYAGQPEEGLRYTLRALRMSPRDPQRHFFFQFHALVLFVAGRYREAAEWSQNALQERPEFPGAMRTRIASYALAGDLGRAQLARRDLEHAQPGLTLSWVDQNADMTDEPRRRIIEGLRLAGLPE